ncbi:NAD(P)-binding protein [Hypoxylon fuscum]|nr:NAD(P)-binding protein [Hypoxylon fuscum]
MANPTVVLITGVSIGLGNVLAAAAYLLRPDHTVIGSVRDARAPSVQELTKLRTAEGSRLVLDIEGAGLDHIDIVISSAAISHPPAPLDALDTELMVEAFRINAIAPVLLFQAVHKLLAKSSAPKWISVSSRPGSIAQPADFYWYIGPYAISKAAQNWFTSTINTAVAPLTAFAIHPGKPPTTAQESTAKIMEVIDAATLEKTAGKFIGVMTGEEYLW